MSLVNKGIPLKEMWIIFLGFVVAYNPFYIFYLLSHAALGGTSRRLMASSIFLIIAVFLSVVSTLVQRGGKVKVHYTTFFYLVSTLLMFYVLSVVVGLILGNNFTYLVIDSFPLLEMFIIYYLIKFSPLVEQGFNFYKMLKYLLIYFFIMALLDLVSYVVVTFGMHITSIWAVINGITVNRLMDFMVPLFFPYFLLSYESICRKKWVLVLIFLSILIMALTFYRTIYLAVFAGLLYLAVSSRERLVFMGKIFMLVVFLSGILLAGTSLFLKDKTFNVPSLFFQRLTSIYSSGKMTASGDVRIGHDMDMASYALKLFPGMTGMGGTYPDASGTNFGLDIFVGLTSNYFLQLILLLGLPAGLLFVWLYVRTFLMSRKYSLETKDKSAVIFFTASASMLLSLAVILCLFPYTCYFPLLYVFSFILGVVDKYGEYS